MPGSPTIKGDNTVLWGSDGVYNTGYITTGSKTLEGEKYEVKDNNGFTVAVIYYDGKKTIRFEMIVKTAAPDLERGDEITACGQIDCLVDTTEEQWSQSGVRMFVVTATFYEGMTLA